MRNIAVKMFVKIVQKTQIKVWHINFFVFLVASVWLSFFMYKYFITLYNDVAFIERNIANTSFIQLNEGAFKEVLRAYQEKLNTTGTIPQGMNSPF